MPKKIAAPRVRAVLFDLGKVLLHFDFEPAFLRLARDCGRSPKDIEAFFIQSGLEVLYDGGRISSHDFYTEVKNALELRMPFDRFKAVWNGIFTPIVPMMRLVRRLRPHYRLVLISNTNAMHFEYLKKRYSIFRLFDRHILSYKEKVRKPDERIYRAAIRACRTRPNAIFYIDDRADLTEAASELGLRTFTFKKNPGDLILALREAGVL